MFCTSLCVEIIKHAQRQIVEQIDPAKLKLDPDYVPDVALIMNTLGGGNAIAQYLMWLIQPFIVFKILLNVLFTAVMVLELQNESSSPQSRMYFLSLKVMTVTLISTVIFMYFYPASRITS